MDTMDNNLRFIETKQLRTTADRFNGATVVVSPADTVFGKLVGALIDPPRRHVSFLVVESRRLFSRHQYVVPFDTARFDDEKRDVPSRWIDERAHELSEDGIGRADHDGGAVEAIRSGPKLFRFDKAEVIVHRVHGARISKLRASLNCVFRVRFVDWGHVR